MSIRQITFAFVIELPHGIEVEGTCTAENGWLVEIKIGRDGHGIEVVKTPPRTDAEAIERMVMRAIEQRYESAIADTRRAERPDSVPIYL